MPDKSKPRPCEITLEYHQPDIHHTMRTIRWYRNDTNLTKLSTMFLNRIKVCFVTHLGGMCSPHIHPKLLTALEVLSVNYGLRRPPNCTMLHTSSTQQCWLPRVCAFELRKISILHFPDKIIVRELHVTDCQAPATNQKMSFDNITVLNYYWQSTNVDVYSFLRQVNRGYVYKSVMLHIYILLVSPQHGNKTLVKVAF